MIKNSDARLICIVMLNLFQHLRW